jgi:hypothetical protein
MNSLIQCKTTILPLLIAGVLACFALSPAAQAVVPAPDGGYPNENTAEGTDALFNLDTRTGFGNTALGHTALYSNTTGSANTATGDFALFSNTTGNDNTANGVLALSQNTTGGSNTANGSFALPFNTTGGFNTANGVRALNSNETGGSNTASGADALHSNRTGSYNTALGYTALYFNTTGEGNTATGRAALRSNTTGNNNAANGVQALFSNTTGIANTASGVNALLSNTTGSYNTAEGLNALFHNTGSSNIGLGVNAGYNLTTGSGNVCIGVNVFGVAGESNTTRIKNVYSSVASARAVYVNSDNKIGTLVSSRRFKDEIKPMDKASEAILALKPVTFRYKKEIEPNGAIMFGLVAEEVEKVAPDLVTRDAKGEVETVRYDAVNAMLLNEFLKEHKRVEAQEQTIKQLKSAVAEKRSSFESKLAEQEKQIDALTSGLQKVSAQLQLGKASPRTVLNDQ